MDRTSNGLVGCDAVSQFVRPRNDRLVERHRERLVGYQRCLKTRFLGFNCSRTKLLSARDKVVIAMRGGRGVNLGRQRGQCTLHRHTVRCLASFGKETEFRVGSLTCPVERLRTHCACTSVILANNVTCEPVVLG